MNHSVQTSELLKKFNLSEDEINKVCAIYQFEKIKKGEKFLEEGMRSTKIGILFGGILYAYSTDTSGDKHISRFFYTPENPIVVNFESFSQGIKSEETIECFETAYMIVFLKQDLLNLYEEIPRLNNIGRLFAEDSYMKALKKIKLLQTQNAKMRVQTFKDQNNGLFTKLPASFIASYLGMHRNTYNKCLTELY